jgi:hypothetical protein
MRENGFKKIVRAVLKSIGVSWIYCPSDRIRSGIPDILSLHEGSMIALELKFFKHKPKEYITLSHPVTAPQSKALRDIHEGGGISAVIIGLPNQMVSIHSADSIKPGINKIFRTNPIHSEKIKWWLEKQLSMKKTDGYISDHTSLTPK